MMTADPTDHSPTSAPDELGTPVLSADQIRALDRAHVLHSWATQGQISPFVVAGAEGRRFWDAEGRRYLDFASLVVNGLRLLPT